jgi:hypothetical protein
MLYIEIVIVVLESRDRLIASWDECGLSQALIRGPYITADIPVCLHKVSTIQ